MAKKKDGDRKKTRTESSDHTGRAQLIWTFCVAVVVALVALQQVASRHAYSSSPALTAGSGALSGPVALPGAAPGVAGRFLSTSDARP